MDKIRILLLEDSPADAELLQHNLSKAGLTFTALRVDTEPAFKQALEGFKPDIVLADYSLPSYNGRAALDYIRQAHPAIPLIIVTGALGEETTAALLRSGAKDYILKDRLVRLPDAVLRALEEKKLRKQRGEAEEKFRKISESAQDAIVMITDKCVSFWNKAAERIYGYTAAEVIGQNMHVLFAPVSEQAVFAQSNPHFQDGGMESLIGKVIELTALRKGGAKFLVEMSVSAVQLNGQWSVIGIVRDITERKAAESQRLEHEMQYRILADSGQALIWTSDTDKLCTYFNQPWLRFTGRTLKQELGNGWTEGVHLDDFVRSNAIYVEAFDRREPFSMEYRLRRHDGEYRWIQDDGCPRYDSHGKFIGYIGYCLDITERKLAEDKLRASEMRYRSLFENMVEGYAYCRMLFEHDKPVDFIYLDVNSEFERITGLKDVVGKKVSEVIPGILESNPELFEIYGRVAVTSQPERFETYVAALGIWFSVTVYCPREEHFVAVFDDVTKRKQAETKLRESEEKFRVIFDGALDGILLADTETRQFFAGNPEICRMLGYSPEELIRLGVADIHPLQELPHVVELFENLARGDTQLALDVPVKRKDGSVFYVDIKGGIVNFGDKTYLAGIFRDITERKQAEVSLIHANRALATLSMVKSSLVHATNEDELLQAICRAIVEQRGYRMAWVGYVKPNTVKTIRIKAHAGHDDGYLDALQRIWVEAGEGRGPCGRAIHDGAVQLCQDIAQDMHYSPWRDNALQRGYAASITLPLIDTHDKVFGIFTVYAEETNAFTPAEANLLEEMARDLSFGVNTLQLRHERDLVMEKSRQQLIQQQETLEDTVRAIASMVEMRDPYTAGHQTRVADLATAIARQMGLPEDRVHGIHLAGTIHDLGKIQIPAEILSKPGRINDIEFNLIKIHPQAGYDILKDINFPWPIAQMVLQHHERLDGSGYPQGLKGDAILLESRILSVADMVEAMYSHRPYRAGLGLDAALAEVTKQRGIYFDPQVVDACLTLFRERHYSFKN